MDWKSSGVLAQYAQLLKKAKLLNTQISTGNYKTPSSSAPKASTPPPTQSKPTTPPTTNKPPVTPTSPTSKQTQARDAKGRFTSTKNVAELLAKKLKETLYNPGEIHGEYEIGDIVSYNGEDHEVTRVEGDRIYIRPSEASAILGKKPAFWVKKDDLEKLKEGLPKGFFKKEFGIGDKKKSIKEDWDSCIAKVTDQGKSQKAAEKICGAINAAYVGNYR